MSADSALWWLSLNLLSILILGFYSMEEMACVSLNKIRLHYYVSQGMKRAIWLNYLLQNPVRLFGTTLICVNVAMFVGSEFARQTYIAMGWNPDLAPITQVFFVVILAELAPMFAARRYAEHAALLGAPILYFSAKIMAPLLSALGLISRFVDSFIGGGKTPEHLTFNQEDLQKIFSLQDEDRAGDIEGKDFSNVTNNIFSLRSKDAKQVMQPLNSIPVLPSNAIVLQVQQLLKKHNVKFIPIYHRTLFHIVGIVYPRDLLRIPNTKRIRDYASPPWFITQNTNIIQILKEFRHNNRNAAVVLNDLGLAIGIITFNDLIEEIFGKLEPGTEQQPIKPSKHLFIIDRVFPGDMKVGDFNSQFDVILDEDVDLTLGGLMARELEHNPENDETVVIPPFELKVVETSLMEVKKIAITTRIR